MRNVVQLILLILAAICFGFAFFDKTLSGHALIAAGLFCWVLVPILNHAYTTTNDTRVVR